MPATLTSETLTDNAIVAAVCAGELQLYRRLYERHAEALQVYVAFRVWVPHLVSEIVQDSFVWAYQHLAEFRAGTSFQAWLRAIAWNLIRAEVQKFAREHQRRKDYAQERLWLELLAVGDAAAETPEADRLRECLGRWRKDSPEERLLHLRYREDLNSREIAERVAQSPVWVRVTLHRIVRQLRECVTKKRAVARC